MGFEHTTTEFRSDAKVGYMYRKYIYIYIYTYISVNKLFIVKKFLILLYLVVLSSIVTWILLKMKLFQTFFKLPSFENFCVFNLEACGICHRFYLNFKNNVLSPHVLHIDSSPRPPPPLLPHQVLKSPLPIHVYNTCGKPCHMASTFRNTVF